MTARVLIVDDDRALCETLEAGLVRRDFNVTFRTSGDEALALLDEAEFDVIVTDLHMGHLDGIALCQRVVARRADIPVVVLTGFGSFDTAVQAIRAGAYDFISKPVQIDVLSIALRRAAQHKALREEVKRLRSAASAPAPAASDLIGTSPAMRDVHDVIARVADSDASVLITGESGTGKELISRAIHRLSPRADGPFVKVNCAAIPRDLIESELFGHERGAFTGAQARKRGFFEQAHGGTLFLDEIGEMTLDVQVKLLRVLQEHEFERLGSTRTTRVNVRVVAATNRDLLQMIEAKEFRADLYYRLSVFPVSLPALRDRPEDIPALAQYFMMRCADRMNKYVTSISPESMEAMLAYDWPGNIRELQNFIERGVILSTGSIFQPPFTPLQRKAPAVVTGRKTLEDAMREHILQALDQTKWVLGGRRGTAAYLGVARTTLIAKMRRLGIESSSTGGYSRGGSHGAAFGAMA
jgi:two-component system, NtrC family, response regulator AtoC